jgi:cytochrome c oxidase subunit 1
MAALATTVFFVGSIFTPWAIVWGSIPVGIALTAWFWPRHRDNLAHLALEQTP